MKIIRPLQVRAAMLAFAGLAALLTLLAVPSAWATTVTITTSGTWTCPAGVTSISVAVQGGGGAGGAGSTTTSARGGGGGGGGCAYSSVVTVVPGTGYTATVGAGGGGGSGSGGAGGTSSFSGSGITTLTANGGGGGALNTGSGAAGGSGGTAVGGDSNKSGGGGDATSGTTAGGAGGGGAGTTGAGGTGNGTTAGAGGTGSPAGGTGASSPAANHAGLTGGAPGGGGSGAYKGSTSVLNGGSGAAGQIVITYVDTPAVPAVTTTAATIIGATGATLNGQITGNGGASVTDYGFYYGTVTPVTAGNGTKVQVGTSDPGTTPFSLAQTGLSANTHYYFATYAVNSAGTTLDSSAQQNFWTRAGTTPPTLLSTFPANNATDVLPAADLVATFDETIVAGSGSIELRRSSNASLVESFAVASSPRLAFSTAQLIIQPTSDLVANQQYYVLIPFGAVKDTSGNSFAGITSATGWRFTVPAAVVLYTDTGSPTNPPWIQVSNTVASAGYIGANYPGPVYGSLINVNNAAVEVGLYGNRPISVPSQHIHVSCNTAATSLTSFTRWFQTDGNTHVLRVFVDDENTATARTGTSSHTEAFMGGGWNYTDNMTYEWTGHYTEAHIRQGFAAFQLKNSVNDWAFQLSMGSDGTLGINNRYGTDVTVTNPDGTAKNFKGGGFDMRVLDDGLNYKVWIDGVLYGNGSYSRPTGTTTFRWGMYFGANNLNPPADYNLLLVSGPQIKSWPGNLATATTTITKANNTTSLDNGASWVGGVDPGLYNQAVWDSTVTAANSTTLASDQQWAGLKILNPGGPVTINGTKILALNAYGVDLTAATQNLAVNCPVQMTVPGTWGVAPGRAASFSGVISGFPGLAMSGGGTVQLGAANVYSGDTTVSAGTLQLGANGAIPGGPGNGNVSLTGTLDLHGFSDTINGLSGAGTVDNTVAGTPTLTIGGNDQSSTFSGSITNTAGTLALTKTGAGTLTLAGANSYGGATTVNGGVLQTISTGSLPFAADVNLSALGATLDLTGTTPTLGSLAGVAGSSVLNNGSLTNGVHGLSTAFAGVISGAGSFTKTGAGTLTLSGVNTYSGGTTVNGGTLQIGATGAAVPVTIANSSFETPAESSSPYWAYNPVGASWTFGGSGGGQQGIANKSTTTWFSTAPPDGNQAGFLQQAGTISQSVNVSTPGVYAISFQAEGRGGTGGPEGVIVQVDGVTVGTWPASAVSQSQWQSFLAVVNLAAGSHTLAFVGNNTLGGDKSIAIDNVQMFQPAGFGALPSGANVNLAAASAVLDLSFSSQMIGSLTGVAGSSVLNGSLAVGGDGTSTTFAGVFSGGGSLTKTGAGTLTLSGANTYGGGTAINSGTLLAGNTIGSATGPGAVNINSGGTLGGYGSISGPVTNNAGGILSPGASVGTLTFSGRLVLNPGSTNLFEVDGTAPTNDVVVLGGAVNYGGVLKIVPTGSFTVGQTFRLFRGAGATNTSNFNSLQGSPGGGKLFTFTNGVLAVVSATLPKPVIAPVTVAGTNLVVSVATVSGVNYVLQSATNLTPTINWLNESTNAGTGTNLILNVPVQPTPSKKFLRIWVY